MALNLYRRHRKECEAGRAEDLDGEQPEWRIPPERMKMRETHIVPLSRQAVEILRDLVVITGRQRYVFPAIGGGDGYKFFKAEDGGEIPAHLRLIFNDKDLFHSQKFNLLPGER